MQRIPSEPRLPTRLPRMLQTFPHPISSSEANAETLLLPIETNEKSGGTGRGERLSESRWRRRRDSNPRDGFPSTPLAGERLRPLGHVSADHSSQSCRKEQAGFSCATQISGTPDYPLPADPRGIGNAFRNFRRFAKSAPHAEALREMPPDR